MKDYLIEMFEYDKAANLLFVDKLMPAENLPGECRQQLYHIGAVLAAWYDTVIGKDESGITDMFYEETVEKSGELLIKYEDKWIELITSLSEEGLNRRVSYENNEGEKFKSSVKEIAAQVITHSVYHRGQINKLLSICGLDTIKQDYIYYLRKNKAF